MWAWPNGSVAAITRSVVEPHACESAREDDERLLSFETPEHDERYGRDDPGGHIGNRVFGQDDDCACDCARSRGGCASHEGFDLGVVAVADEPSAGDDDAEVDGDEDRDGRDGCACEAADEVPDE